MIIKVGGLEPLGPIGVYAYACNPCGVDAYGNTEEIRLYLVT